MASSGFRSLIIVLLLPFLLCTLGINALATVENYFPYLTEGKVYLSEDFRGSSVQDSQALHATDYYYIQITFSNPSEETRSFPYVFYVVLVLDEDGYAQYADLNTYGEQVWSGGESSRYQLRWFPHVPGDYTIRTFLISDLDHPQILTSVATSHVTVKDKMDKLGEGEENNRLRVESINCAENTAKIVYNYCNEISP